MTQVGSAAAVLLDAWEPLDDGAIGRLADRLANASVVGIGGTTREAAEVFDLQANLVLALVARGTRTVVIHDAIETVARYDSFVAGDRGHLELAIAEAWGPWRVQPLADLLTTLRAYTARHPDDPVHVVGTTPARASLADYDLIAAAAARLAPAPRRRVTDILLLIRQAHDSGEHALRAQGDVSGDPFVDRARTARSLLADIMDDVERGAMDRIVDFHATSISQGADPMSGSEAAVRLIVDDHVALGRKVVVLDGVTHLLDRDKGLGGWFARLLGDSYRAVAITFGEGRVRGLTMPPPSAGTVDHLMHTMGRDGVLDVQALDDIGRALIRERPTVRLISGMYRVDDDAEHRLLARGFADAAAIIHVRSITPIVEL